MSATDSILGPDCSAHGGSVHRLVRHLDLFSGIGGFALAARMVGGIETVAFCEIEKRAQEILAKNFPGIPIHDDVKTLNPTDYGTIDLITGGYPCQPFSHAGKRQGAADDRHLWPFLFGIIERCKPRWVLCENVAGHISLGLDQVLSDLESAGYSWGALVIPACAVGARHIRERVWILADSHGQGPAKFQRPGPELERTGSNWRSVSDNWHQWNPHSAFIRRGSDGLPGRVDRIRALGNAIVPQVAAEILRCMMAVDSCLSNVKATGPQNKSHEK